MTTDSYPTRPRAALAAAIALAGLVSTAVGQEAAGRNAPAPGPRLKAPIPYQVIQRDARGLAEIPVALPDELKGAEITAVLIRRVVPNGGLSLVKEAHFVDGKLVGVPAGRYRLSVGYKTPEGGGPVGFDVEPIFVGDLWVLAGQSNMEGYGRLIDVAKPDDRVMCLGMDGKWTRAEEPLHWLVDSPDPVHSGDPATRGERSARAHRDRTKGAGLGLPFAKAMVAATGVPVGLVACAHGGTSMDQWSPSKKDEGGRSLYGSMLRQVRLAGGKVKGVLWYQGESDARDDLAPAYEKKFIDFIAAVRADLGQPDLPFDLVQIGRHFSEDTPKGWDIVQEAERKIPDEVPNTAVVASVDLPLDDGIHIATPGLERLGRRLANVALREEGKMGATTPTLDRVGRGPDNTLVVRFKGVNRVEKGGRVVGLTPERNIAGFSIRKADGAEAPLIFDAQVGPSGDVVILRLDKALPEGATLSYGWGRFAYCNLVDARDMAVPAFGPIALDDLK